MFKQFGDPQGTKTVIYFHGAPGSALEAEIFDQHAKKQHIRLLSIERFSLDQQGQGYYQQLAQLIDTEVGAKPCFIIGFSIGTQVAIRCVPYLKVADVQAMHLISSAAPLVSTDFIEHIAGGPVFKLAMKKPFLFKLITYWQKLILSVAPRQLFKLIFANASGEDKKLSADPAFKTFINKLLTDCFADNIQGYIRDITSYVHWHGSEVKRCQLPCQLWHGTEDNWSTPEMAEYFSQHLSGPVEQHSKAGLSHYSCLYQCAELICSQIAASHPYDEQVSSH